MIDAGIVKSFVVVSGLPGCGKSTLAQRLAPALGLPLLDKDVILERLFESRGLGDAERRRSLSRESDLILEAEATALEGGVLVSHWRVAGMAPNYGTPTEWISKLSASVINVHCVCPAEVAAERFILRRRHPGHLDHKRSRAEVMASILGLAGSERLKIGPCIDVDTSQAVDVDAVVREIKTAFTHCRPAR